MTHQEEVASRLAQLRRVKSARELRDITHEEIADAVGISAVTYSRYESGKRKVPEEVIQSLATYHGVTAWFIRYGVESTATTGMVPDAVAEAITAREDARLAATQAADQPRVRRAKGQR